MPSDYRPVRRHEPFPVEGSPARTERPQHPGHNSTRPNVTTNQVLTELFAEAHNIADTVRFAHRPSCLFHPIVTADDYLRFGGDEQQTTSSGQGKAKRPQTSGTALRRRR